MAEMKNFIIALTMVSLVIGSFGIFWSHLSQEYSVNYDEENFESYNNLNAIYNQTKDIERETTAIDPNQGPIQTVVSVLDGFFTGAYNALVLSFQSFDIFTTVSDQAIEDVGASAYSGLFKQVLGIITLIVLIFIIVRAIVKVNV